MRTLLTILLLLPFWPVQAQETVELYNTEHKLNGGIRSQFGGVSRIACPLRLPPYTSHILLTISTAQGEGISATELAIDAANIASNGALSAFTSLSNISYKRQRTGQQSGLVDYYIFYDLQCAQLFIDKTDRQCRWFGMQNITGGTFTLPVKSSPYQQTIWIGIRNPSETTATYCRLEAVAVTN